MLFAVAALFQTYSTEQPYSYEAPERVARDHLTLSQRLGYAILLRAGYATVKLVVPGDQAAATSTPKPEQEVQLELNPTVTSELQCLDENHPFVVPGVGEIDTKFLTMAIVAAEKYNRPALQRQLEAWFAERWLRSHGELREFSFGLAQIRPATARRLLQEEMGQYQLSDRDLLTLLMNDCQNVRLAAKYVESLCHQFSTEESVDAIIAKVALTYSGGVRPTVDGLRYVDAVTGAYHLLNPQPPGEPAERSSTRENGTACVSFRIGSVIPQEHIGEMIGSAPATSRKGERPAEVKVYVWNNDPGPKAYVALLAARRREWLVGKLVEIGYSRDRVAITELSSPERLWKICGHHASPPSWAAIEVQRDNRSAKRP